MSSSKSRRRVTVDQEHSLPSSRSSESSSEKRSKKSVFQRLGTAPQEVCHQYLQSGHCNYGPSCKYSHPSRSSKDGNERERSADRDELRHRFARKRDHSESDPESSKPKKRDRSEKKAREKDNRPLKSAVVVSKSKAGDAEYDPFAVNENQEDSDLDMDSTVLLMQKRYQLQQQLNELEEAEKAELDEPGAAAANKRPKHVLEENEVPTDDYRQKSRHPPEDPVNQHKLKDKKKKKRKDKQRRSGSLNETDVHPEGSEKKSRRHSKEGIKGRQRSPEARKEGRSRSKSPYAKKKQPKKKRDHSGDMDRKQWTPKKEEKSRRSSMSPHVKKPKHSKNKRSLSPDGRRKDTVRSEGERLSRGRVREGAKRKTSTSSSSSSSSSSSTSSSSSGSSSSSSSSSLDRKEKRKKASPRVDPSKHKSRGREEELRREEVIPPSREEYSRSRDFEKGPRPVSPSVQLKERPAEKERDYRERKDEKWKRDENFEAQKSPDFQKRYDRQYREEYYREKEREKARETERPREERPREERPREERPREERPREERLREERPREDRTREERPREDRPREERPREDRPREERPREDRPREERPREDRPREERPREDRPREERLREERPREEERSDDRQREKGERDKRYREAERREEHARAAEDPRLREADRMKERDLHHYYKEYEQFRLLEASKYQEQYAADLARHAEYDRAAYERYLLEVAARKDDPRLREYMQAYGRDERLEAYYRYRREHEESHRLREDRSRHDERRREEYLRVDDRGRYIDERGRVIDKRELERRYEERARMADDRSRHYDVREEQRSSRQSYPETYDDRHSSRRQHWEETQRLEQHAHHAEYDERTRAYSTRRREEAVSPHPAAAAHAGSPSSSAAPLADYKRSDSYRRRAKEDRGLWDEHHAREQRSEEETQQRNQSRSDSYDSSRQDKRRHQSPSWDGRESKRSRKEKDWSQDATYSRERDSASEWHERPTEAPRESRRQSDHHRSSSKDVREHAPADEERSRRSLSRSSLGSRHSYPEDRHRVEREPKKEEETKEAVVPQSSDEKAPTPVQQNADPDEKDIKEEVAPEPQEPKEEKVERTEESKEPVEEKEAKVEEAVDNEEKVEEPVADEKPREVDEKVNDEEALESVSSNGDLASQMLESMELPADGGQSPEYDDISDDDFDDLLEGDATHENGTKSSKGIDALGIDWKSLAAQTKPAAPSTKGALQRFSPAAIFARIGISEECAGKDLTAQATNLCQEFFKEERVTVKDDKLDNTTPEPKITLNLLGMKIPGSQTNTLKDIGPARRALCARRDLYLRRKLCKVEKLQEGFNLYPLPVVDQELYKQSMALFKQDSQIVPEAGNNE